MPGQQLPAQDRVRTAEIIAALCLATDLGMGFPLEHGLQSTLLAMRLCDRLGVDDETRSQTYYGCLLLYVGCTADAEVAAELFGEGALPASFIPVVFGSPAETMAGIVRALGGTEGAAPRRAMPVARTLPRALLGHRRHIDALCEVGEMLSERLGMPPPVQDLFAYLTERWDGRAYPGRHRGDDIPLPIRIAHVARDAMQQYLLGGPDYAARVVRARAGGAFDPAIAILFADHAASLLDQDDPGTTWDATLAAEPRPWSILDGDAIDGALAAMGDFADLASPYLVGHSGGVATLAATAAERYGFQPLEVVAIRRADRPRHRASGGPRAHLAEARDPDDGRVGAGTAAPVPVRTNPVPVTAARRSGRLVRHLPSRTQRRQRLPPGLDGRRAPAGCPATRCRGQLPRDDRASVAPRAP